MTEKIEWYKEVLELEPNSKVFFPLARLLADEGQLEEAIGVLEHGLERHEEFLEARLFLIELLRKAGNEARCREQVARLSKMFSSYAGFWQAWAACLSSDAREEDTASILRFLAAHFVAGPIHLHDVLNRGLESMLAARDTASEAAPQAMEIAAEAPACQDMPEQPLPHAEDAPENAASPDAALELESPEPETPLEDEPSIPESEQLAQEAAQVLTAEDEAQAGSQAELAELDGQAELDAPEPEQPEIAPAMSEEQTVQADAAAESGADSPELPEIEMEAASLPETMEDAAFPLEENVSLPLNEEELPEEVSATPEPACEQPQEEQAVDLPPGEGLATDLPPAAGDMAADLPDTGGAEAASDEEEIAAADSFPVEEPATENLEMEAPEIASETQQEQFGAERAAELEDMGPAEEQVLSDQVADEAEADSAVAEEIDVIEAEPVEDLMPVHENPAEAEDVSIPEDSPLDAAAEAAGSADSGMDDELSEEPFSLRTRSMAEVLAEQGDTQGALDIYQELAASASDEREAEDINRRIETLRARLGLTRQGALESEQQEAPEDNKDKVIAMLEALARRVEARAHS